ncbi:MAG TPA: MFS transporter [Candidatus Binatia bacterium]|jgi:MFS family permease
MSVSPVERARGRWAALTLVTLCHIVGATAQYGINTLAPFYQQDLELSRTQIGLFFTAFYTGMAGLSFPAGWLADRLGVRTTTLNGHLFLGLFTLTASLAPSFPWALGSFFLAGLGYSFLNPASTRGVMAWFGPAERATAMGAKQTGVPAGGVVTALVAPLLVSWVGWRGALAALGVSNLLFGFLFFALWREPVRTVEHARTEAGSAKITPAFNVQGLLAVSVGTSVLLVAQMALLTYTPLYLKETMGLSSYWASQALAVIQFGAMIGRVGWGLVSDRLFGGRRKVVLVLIGAISIMLCLAMGFMSPGTPAVLLLLVIFLAGLCMVGFQGVSYALIGELAGPAQTGAALGLVITVNSLGTIFGNPLFGYLVDRSGSYSIAWQSLAGVILVGIAALMVFLKEPRRGAS